MLKLSVFLFFIFFCVLLYDIHFHNNNNKPYMLHHNFVQLEFLGIR